MGLLADNQSFRGRKCSWGFGSLGRRKQVDSVHVRKGGNQLARELSAIDLVAIGVGATIGAGVYILVGTVAREHSGPALAISFLIAGIAAGLSAFSYAELACRCPSAGSAYHYSYICVGEGVAWLIGWALILEYTIGSSAVARGITPNLALLLGGEDKLPTFLARHTFPWLDMVVDPCAAVLVIIVTALLCIGIKESSMAQTIVTMVNVSSLLFIIIAGGYLGFKTGWPGYDLPRGYFPFGVNGMFAGSAVVFFSYIGFDSVTSTAEELVVTLNFLLVASSITELKFDGKDYTTPQKSWGNKDNSSNLQTNLKYTVKRPQRDLPLGIGLALSICCILYMLVSIVIVGLVPYYSLDPNTPISTAFSSYGMQWAMYIINIGAVTALFASLTGSILPQPRVLMAMARDGLLPSFFSDINAHTKVPVKSTITTGVFAASLAFIMDVSQLSGMVSVGTLLAFTTAAISVLILRYVPPDEMPLPLSLNESIDSVSSHLSDDIQDSDLRSHEDSIVTCETNQLHTSEQGKASVACPLIIKEGLEEEENEMKRRKIASWSIALVCIGILVLASAASAQYLPSLLRITLCGGGGGLLLCSLTVLAFTDQDNARHGFGHAGGFVCPFVPYLPVTSILINTYLLVNLGAGTWIRVSVWLIIGAFVYIFYGRTHSLLLDAVYVPTAYANEIIINQATSSDLH